jgi:hypothetical protein
MLTAQLSRVAYAESMRPGISDCLPTTGAMAGTPGGGATFAGARKIRQSTAKIQATDSLEPIPIRDGNCDSAVRGFD